MSGKKDVQTKQISVPAWVPDWLTRSRAGERKLSRGTAEASVLVVIGSLVAGVLFGTGLTRTAVHIGDGLTWFSDSPTGEVIQVNPATGKPETRLDVGKPGDSLGVAQWDGRLVVTNQTTGELTSYDLSSILVSGQRRVSTGGATDVLHHGDDVYLVDKDHGSLAAIDPVSTDTVGQMWQSATGIADAAVDGKGQLWVIDPKGTLTELRWSASSGAFVTDHQRVIDHSGPGSVLVAHDQGVTVFGPDAGIVVQSDLADGDAVVAGAPRLSGELLTPATSPADLVPVSSPSTGTVVIVSGGKVHEVDVTAIGCSHPGTPEVFEDQVYVSCPGDHKVVRLSADGARAGDDIAVPDGGDPALIVDDGKLMINVPGAEHGVVVDKDGAVSSVTRYDDTVPTLNGQDSPQDDPTSAGEIAVQDTPTALPTDPSAPTSNGPTQTPSLPTPTQSAGPGNGSSNGPGHDDTNGHDNGPGNNSTELLPTPSIPTAGPLQKPYNVYATSLPTGEIQVNWSYGNGAVDGFTVEEAGGQPLVRVDAVTRKAVVTLPPGAHRFTVTANRAGTAPVSSSYTTPVSASARPTAPSDIKGVVQGSDSSASTTVSMTWTAASDNGSAIVDYQVVAKDSFGTHQLTTSGTTAKYTVTCAEAYCDPGPVSVTVTARNAVGSGDAATATLQYAGPQPPPAPAAGQQLVTAATTTWDDAQGGTGTTVLSLNPPSDWATFYGTCTWTHTGNQNGATSGTYPCNATSVQIPINTGYQTSGDGTVSHSIVFTANGVRGTSVQSAPFDWTTQQVVITGDIP